MSNKTGQMNREKHPDWYYPIENMKGLILGSYPPHESKWDYEFYYPNKRNRFWKVLAQIAKIELNENEGEEAVKLRKRIMEVLHVGVQNMGLIIERKGKSAKDKDITIIEFQDIVSIIKTHNELKGILISGFSDEYSSTYATFIKYLNKEGISHNAPAKGKVGLEFQIFDPRLINCYVVNSTSPNAFQVPFENLEKQFSIFLKKIV